MIYLIPLGNLLGMCMKKEKSKITRKYIRYSIVYDLFLELYILL